MAGRLIAREANEHRAAVEVRRFDDPAVFLARAGPLLLADEARHNLMLGICGRLRSQPDGYPGYSLWGVEDGGEVTAAAVRTPPWNLVLARPVTDAAVQALADGLAERGIELPGVTAARPEGDLFSRAWQRATGRSARIRMRQGIYRLTSVRPVDGVPGTMRKAVLDDRDLLREWIGAFKAEALSGDSPMDVGEVVDRRLAAPGEGMTLWEDPDPVSLAGYGGSTPNGVRIGPVYTPQGLRRRGYASALVAQTSQGLLEKGYRFCFLYTDLSNPTANAIYQRIGYELVCESAEFAFEPADQPVSPEGQQPVIESPGSP